VKAGEGGGEQGAMVALMLAGISNQPCAVGSWSFTSVFT